MCSGLGEFQGDYYIVFTLKKPIVVCKTYTNYHNNGNGMSTFLIDAVTGKGVCWGSQCRSSDSSPELVLTVGSQLLDWVDIVNLQLCNENMLRVWSGSRGICQEGKGEGWWEEALIHGDLRVVPGIRSWGLSGGKRHSFALWNGSQDPALWENGK